MHGLETTLLESKVGGYVKEFGKVTDAAGHEVEVDIGAVVEKGQLLAVLDAPEMQDELKEKQAGVMQAETVVVQAEAMIRQAEAQIASARAAVDEARTELQEKQALRELSHAEYQNQRKLYSLQATTRELVDKARSKWDAASAMLQTVDARIRTAEAGLNAAAANLQKAEADLNHAQAQVDVAKAAASRSQTWIDYANITAPFAGIIAKRMVDHGAFVRPATSNSSAMPLFEIVRTDKVSVEASVPMSRAARVQVGQTAVFHTIGGLPGVTVQGTVTRSASVFDQDTRMMGVHVDLTNPVASAHFIKQDGQWTQASSGSANDADTIQLRPGMFGTLTILETWNDLAIVPTTAVGTDDSGNPYTLVIADEGQTTNCRRRSVTVVFNDAKDVGLSSGVEAGETVVARNVNSLRDGESVVTSDAG